MKNVILILSILIILNPYCIIPLVLDYEVYMPIYYVILLLIALFSAICLRGALNNTSIKIDLNIVDLLICFFILLTLVRSLNQTCSYEYCLNNIHSVGLFLLILVLRNFNLTDIGTGKIFSITILTSGILQASIGLAQLLTNIRNYSYLNITGTFNNPGPYSNYLALIFPFALAGLFDIKECDKKDKILKGLSIIFIMVLILVLPFTKARTSWIAILCALILFYTPFFKKWFGKYFFLKNIRKQIVLCLLFLLSCVFIFFLYQYKPQSANGRLLIYKVCVSMIKEHPFAGYGPGSFSLNYNSHQAKYFSGKDLSNESYLAADNKVAFNEFLQIWLENGLPGIVFLLLIFYYCFKSNTSSDYMSQSLRGLIIVFFICSLFSYPLGSLPAQVIIMIGIALTNFKPRNLIQVKFAAFHKRAISVGMILICSFIAYFCALDYHARREWKKIANEYIMEDNQNDILTRYEAIYIYLKYDRFFLYNYGSQLSQINPKLSIKILSLAARHMCNSDLYSYLGASYFKIQNYQDAIKCYQFSSNMVPNKFYPKYQLFKLYCHIGDIKQASQTAIEIANLGVKIPSYEVDQIKKEIEQWINNQNANYKTLKN